MSVFIRCPDNPTEFGLIELQGTLVPKQGSLPGQKIGTLQINTKGNPTLVIGNHLLEGKIITLQKPLLVLQKEEQFQEPNLGEWGTVAVIRKKYAFLNKPESSL